MNKKNYIMTLTNQLDLAIKNKDSKSALEILNPLIEIGSKMLLEGTLKKNVVRFFTNNNIGLDAATNLMELSEIRADEFKHYKSK